MLVLQPISKICKGLSFGIADLTLAGAWAEASGLRLIVRLDHGTSDEEFEETLTFLATASAVCRWIIWRNADAVFVQPLIGRTRRYGSLVEAIETLVPPPPVILTDITAMHWPT
jgi:hypothetical protein